MGSAGPLIDMSLTNQDQSGSKRPGSALLAILALCWLLTACARQSMGMPEATTAATPPPASATTTHTALLAPTATLPAPIEAPATLAAEAPPAGESVIATAPATVVITPAANVGPFAIDGNHCGIHLPVIAAPNVAITELPDVATALNQIPAEARPAVDYLLAHPAHVGLAAYQVGREAEGVYLNADNPLPLASVVKVIHLIAYVDAVQLGEIDPASVVALDDVARYYLPNSDLGAHPRAVETLQEEGRVFGQPPSILLEDVPRMMMEFSSNAATDYLHMLMGQERIEATALALGMNSHTAPCPFLGQFLLMGDRAAGLSPIVSLIENPEQYSRHVMELTEQYSGDSAFRNGLSAWSNRDARPPIEAQYLFSEQLNAHGSAREYAHLMAQIALNNMGPWEQSVHVRRYMEWPTHFPNNQEKLAWLGYKGGSLPGVLTVVYYAQPWDTLQPVVVALFFHDLPRDVYRDWRRSLPHDELARWLLRDRDAIPLIQALLN